MTTTRVTGLSDKQLSIIGAIQDLTTQSNFIPPRFEDIARRTGYSGKDSIKHPLDELRSMGYIDWEDRKPRTIHLTATGKSLLPTVPAPRLAYITNGRKIIRPEPEADPQGARYQKRAEQEIENTPDRAAAQADARPDPVPLPSLDRHQVVQAYDRYQAIRDTLGRVVREAWVKWALEQPAPKNSWLIPYDRLDEADKEADRRIGEAVALFLSRP